MNNTLNSKQLEAVKSTDGPLLVLAGAGTGKTRVLTHRIAYIVSENLAYANEILAVTFTNKAANEMKERVGNLIDSFGLNIGTFHSIAAKILRSHAEYFNLTSAFTIIDSDDQIRLIKTILKEHEIDNKSYSPRIIHSIISRWKDMGLVPEKISDSDIKTKFDKVANEIYSFYQMKLVESNAVDFGDILLYITELFLSQPDIARIYQNKFKYVLIDEYQDVNAVQYIWLRIIANKYQNICCVGDDDQSIYSWRGAEVENILKFEKDFPQAKIVKLEQNYRSTTPILEVASSLINNNNLRHSKTLWTDHPQGGKVKVIKCFNDKEEAKLITLEIKILLKQNKLIDNIAVLVRTTFQTRIIEDEFIGSNISYKIIGGMKFYERAEIKDVIAYIRLTMNHCDNLAFERIINVPKRGFGPVYLNNIREFAAQNSCSLFDALKSMLEQNLIKRSLKKLSQDFINNIMCYSERFSNTNDIYKDLQGFLHEIGYIPMLQEQKTEEAKSKLDNIYEMLKAITEYKSLEGFIEHILLVAYQENRSEVKHKIYLMTLHASKGLEFDAVFMPGFEEGIFPHQRTIDDSGAKGIEEERRIAYVGITRAKQILYILHSESRRVFGAFNYSTPSRFLSELPAKHIERYSSHSFLTKIERKNNTQNIIASHIPQYQPDDIKVGSKISHKAFGSGVLIGKYDDIYDIAFDEVGIKKIKKDFVEVN